MKKLHFYFGRAEGEAGALRLVLRQISVTWKDLAWLAGTAAALGVGIASGASFLRARFPFIRNLF